MRIHPTLLFLALTILGLSASARATGEPPVAVSPGSATSELLIEARCPTFSWGSVRRARAYELVVSTVDASGRDVGPVLQVTVPGSAHTWTPSLDRCLERGQAYAWSVRASKRSGASDWSGRNLFQIAGAASVPQATLAVSLDSPTDVEVASASAAVPELGADETAVEDPVSDDPHLVEEEVLDALADSVPPTPGDVVIASERVTNSVRIRERPTTQSASIGQLTPGQRLDYVGSVPRWHEVMLSDGRHGFVSKAWTHVVARGVGGGFTLDVVDVGTGLAVLVTGPNFNLVYDAGSNDDLARGDKNRFLAFLESQHPELSTIHHLVVSHPHRDHVELLPDLFDNYSIEHVWDSGAINPICGYRAFLRAVAESTTVYHSARSGFGTQTIPFGEKRCYGQDLPAEDLDLLHGSRIDDEPVPLGQSASMTFLHADGSHHNSFNENSLVVRLDLGETRVLIMGDAEAGGRQDPETAPVDHSIEGILLDCCKPDIRSDLLIVGHHGSKTSSRTAFLDAVGAVTAIVSSGPKKYSSVTLPDQVVITELETRGSVFRTDLNDDTCATNPAKIGPDNDGKAGGCDNVRITIQAGLPPAIDYLRPVD